MTIKNNTLNAEQHQPVLLSEAIDAMQITTYPGACYLDATFGCGGHARAILNRLSEQGQLIVLDRDPAAIAIAQSWQEPRCTAIQTNYAQLDQPLQQHTMYGAITAVLMDLGVSSPQLDQSERGFSFSQDGPLDMRMDQQTGQPVWQWLARASERTIADVLFYEAEEPYSRRIARAICTERSKKTIRSTKDLAQLVARAIPHKQSRKHPATRTFQALRRLVNQEQSSLEQGLVAVLNALKPTGRLVIISFHSLEDRTVKHFIRSSHCAVQLGQIIQPTHQEFAQNPRARSAKMRVIEKCAA